MFVTYLRRVMDGGVLSSDEAYAAMMELVHGEVAESQAAAFFAALRLRRERAEELGGFARALLDEAVSCRDFEGLLDTCGTGGDGLGTFNISTAAAIVCAACGVKVAKHGNRAATSRAGSADVLEALGVRVSLELDEARRALDEVGMSFLFAPAFHPAMKKFAPMRRSLGIATAFNFLGPLVNPFHPAYQVMGIADPRMMEPVAGALALLGRQRALVVHAEHGMDEITHRGRTEVVEVAGGERRRRLLQRGKPCSRQEALAAIRGGEAEENARIVAGVLAGEQGEPREIVVLNAAVYRDKVSLPDLP
ncbi:MAG: anthranilate phosphoribosyltransferase, partial [Syntrophomonadaceae bacterium]|nr:anthranilate phosphoribosyltransferase [Syntrophomonadaceae bacterium]